MNLSHVQVETALHVVLVDVAQVLLQIQQRRLVLGLIGELLVDAGRAGLLVLEQRVGDAAIGRYGQDAVVDVIGIAENDVVQAVGKTRHRRAADLLHAQVGATHGTGLLPPVGAGFSIC